MPDMLITGSITDLIYMCAATIVSVAALVACAYGLGMLVLWLVRKL